MPNTPQSRLKPTRPILMVETKQQVSQGTSIAIRIAKEAGLVAVITSIIGIGYQLALPAIILPDFPPLVTGMASDASNSVQLAWTAPGDDGNVGQALEYDIRYSTESISVGNWESASRVADAPAPKAAGSSESMLVAGLVPKTTYYFALRTKDDAGNWSPISNIATSTTACFEAWSCSAWSLCSNHVQTRICQDLNSCGTTNERPITERSCGEDETPPEEGAGGAEQDGYQQTFVVAAPNAGGPPEVRVFTADGRLTSSFYAFHPNYRGGVNLAVEDLGSDSVDEIVVGPGPDAEPMVKIFTRQGRLISQFLAYDRNFRGGVNVAIGNIDGDNDKEIIVAPASKGGPNIRIFGYVNGHFVPVTENFFAYPGSLRGGWRIAAGDLENDGKAEIITAPGPALGGPHVRVFSYRNGRMVPVIPGFMAYHQSFRGGVMLALGDRDGNGTDSIFTIPESRGGPHLRVFRRNFDSRIGLEHPGVFAFHPNFRGGTSVTIGDVNGNRAEDIIVGVLRGDRAWVRVFTEDLLWVRSEFLAFPESMTSGINVAAGQFFPPL